MSRTASSNPLHLIVQQGPRGAVLFASETQPVFETSVTITREAYRTFRLYMLYLFQAQKKFEKLHFGELTEIDDTLKNVLYFLYADIARLVAPGLTSEHEQLERTALALHPYNVTIPPAYYQTLRDRPIRCTPDFDTGYFNPKTWYTIGRHFFDVSVEQRINPLLHPLLNASLNADLERVQRIVAKTSSGKLHILLSTRSTATMDHLKHLGIQRTGTSLQMAIYDDDEEMVAYLKTLMDPEEFDCQCKEAFGSALPPKIQAELNSRNASVLDYCHAMIKVQKEDAAVLCAGLEDVFKVANSAEFTCDANYYVASTTSIQVQDAMKAFTTRLLEYVRKTPAHNPYILHHVYDIYDRLPSAFARDCFFSQKVIGGVQSLLSACWLHHVVRGIYYLAEKEKSPRRSFLCRASKHPVIDIRHLVSSGAVGRDSFLSIYGWEVLPGCFSDGLFAVRGEGSCVTKLMSSKNSKLGRLMQVPAHKQNRSCCAAS